MIHRVIEHAGAAGHPLMYVLVRGARGKGRPPSFAGIPWRSPSRRFEIGYKLATFCPVGAGDRRLAKNKEDDATLGGVDS